MPVLPAVDASAGGDVPDRPDRDRMRLRVRHSGCEGEDVAGAVANGVRGGDNDDVGEDAGDTDAVLMGDRDVVKVTDVVAVVEMDGDLEEEGDRVGEPEGEELAVAADVDVDDGVIREAKERPR